MLQVSVFYDQQFKSFILEGTILGFQLLEDPQIWFKQFSLKHRHTLCVSTFHVEQLKFHFGRAILGIFAPLEELKFGPSNCLTNNFLYF